MINKVFNKQIHRFYIFFSILVLLLNITLQENNAAATFIPLNSATTISPAQTVFFTNVSVDPNIIPNKPFQVSADLQSVNPSQLLVSISVSPDVSVTSPVVAKLTNSPYGNTVRATWTLVTGKPGSYPITINAVSNFPIDSQQFTLNITVGYSKSLVVTDINVPGNIIQNTIFPVTLNLKNILSIPDSNIIAQISVPTGLAILNNPTSYIASLDPSKEAQFKWNVMAGAAGSYVISINYTSAVAGSHTETIGVNVGKFAFADITTQSVTINGIPTLSPSAAPGDKFLPLDVKLINTGTIPIYNMTSKLVLGNVFTIRSSQNENNVSNLYSNVTNFHPDIFQTGVLEVGQTIDAVYYVDIPNNITTGIYDSYLSVTFSDGNKLYSKDLSFPILISNTGIKISSVTLNGITSYPGDVADQLNVKLLNTGSYVANVQTTLKLPNELMPSWGNSTSAYFAQINPLQTVNATYYINIPQNASAGHHPLSMIVTTQKGETVLPIDFIVSPKAIFVLKSVDSSQLYPGASNVPLTITLENNATIPANFVTTKLLTGNLIPGVKSTTLTAVGNEENVGTIQPGQVFTTTFLVDMDPAGKSGDQSTSLEIDWTQNDAGTTPFVQSLPVQLSIPQGASYMLYEGGIPLLYILIVVVIITLIIVFSRMRKKRLELINSALKDESNKMNYIQIRDEVEVDEKDEMSHDSP